MSHSKDLNPWLTYVHSRSQMRLRVFCFPYAGGGASIYATWLQALPPEIAVCPVQLPGRGSRIRERPFNQLVELLPALVPALQPLMNVPFAFFGHSMGALIGFELARELRRRNLPGPVHLFVSGHRAPQLPDPDPPMHDMPDAELIKELVRLNGTPKEILENQQLMELLLPLLRADTSLCETYAYTPDPPLNCPISVFGGSADAKVTRSDLEGWKTETTQGCIIRMFPGDHFFIHSPTPLLRALQQDLEPTLAGMP